MAGQAECFGRDAPLAALDAFLDGVGRGPSALVIEGDTGIGKTAVWQAGVELAEARAYRVLPARAVQAESALPYCALGDIVDLVDPDVLSALPIPQRRALDMAALVTDGDDRYETGERHAGVAFLSILRTISRDVPVLVAVDDVEWLDGPSARTITFALRRLRSEPVGLLATWDKLTDVDDPLDLDRSLPAAAIRRVRLGPLSADALRRVVRERVGPDLPNTTLFEIERLSSGNPSIAIEIARATPLTEAPGKPLLVPPRLRAVARDELHDLAPGVVDVLVVVAALTEPRVSLIEQIEGPDTRARLASAEAAGIVAVEGDRAGFVHPLTGSALYLDASADARRRIHRRVAEIVIDPEERSFHLALATEGPDEVVAAALDAAAVAARARGARARAAELREIALSLTPEEFVEDIHRRTLQAADDHAGIGNCARARRLLEDAMTTLRPGPARAEVLARLGRIRAETDSLDAAVDLGEQALTEAAAADALRGAVAGDLAAAQLLRLDVERASAYAAAALDRAEELGDDALISESIGMLARSDTLVGGNTWAPILDVGIRLERVAPSVRPTRGASYARAERLLWAGELEGARRVLLALSRETVDGRHRDARPSVLAKLVRLECEAGDWDRAAELVEEAALETSGGANETQRAFVLSAKARISALRGEEEAARDAGAAARSIALHTGCRAVEVEVGATLGLLELSLGDAVRADAELRPVVAAMRAAGIREPGALHHVPDVVEAALAIGQADHAADVLEPFETMCRTLDVPWGIAVAARCRGLLRAAAGDIEGALGTLDGAVTAHDRASMPFERARTLLVHGRTLRRAKQWGPARESLEQARGVFETLGARSWVDATCEDLSRIGGRSPSSDSLLTPGEQQAAELVERGMTNREVADTLFISLKTVEAILTRVYRKLGVGSRTELRARFAGNRPSGDEAPDRG